MNDIVEIDDDSSSEDDGEVIGNRTSRCRTNWWFIDFEPNHPVKLTGVYNYASFNLQVLNLCVWESLTMTARINHCQSRP